MKLYPRTYEYKNIYNNAMYRIESKKGELFFIDNWVTAWNAFVGKEIDNLTVIIEKEKKTEDDLRIKLRNLERLQDGAAGARKGMTDSYKLQYVSNIFSFIGILGAIAIIGHMYMEKVQ